MQTRIRQASEGRGFSQSRVLTHWAEIVGQDVARCAQPVNVSYAKGGLGATLTLLTTGAHAPILEMQKEQIRERVNACYGYGAISRVRITQTAPTGFGDERASFRHAPRTSTPDSTVRDAAKALAQNCRDDELREALVALGANVLSKQKTEQR